VHPRQNRIDDLLLTQNANVGEECEFAAPAAVSYAPSRELFVFRARHGSHLDQSPPVFFVTALVDQEVAAVPGSGEWRGINEELVADYVEDAHLGLHGGLVCSSWFFPHRYSESGSPCPKM
jgi:hypothetical protein